MNIQEEVVRIYEENIPDPDIFPVEITVHLGKQSKIRITIDGDEGVSAEQCASVSRRIGKILEETEVMKGPYNLEVTSPGVDKPLKLPRQYPKHVGRDLELSLKDTNEPVTGEFSALEEDEMIFIEEKKVKVEGKKKKEIVHEERRIPLSEITEAKVLISFKKK